MCVGCMRGVHVCGACVLWWVCVVNVCGECVWRVCVARVCGLCACVYLSMHECACVCKFMCVYVPVYMRE